MTEVNELAYFFWGVLLLILVSGGLRNISLLFWREGHDPASRMFRALRRRPDGETPRMIHRERFKAFIRRLSCVRVLAPFVLVALPIPMVRYFTHHMNLGTALVMFVFTVVWAVVMMRCIRDTK